MENIHNTKYWKWLYYKTTSTYHWLFGYVHQVFNVVILMFLKGWKKHVQHLLFISSSPFSIFFLLLLIFNLSDKKHILKHWYVMLYNSQCWTLRHKKPLLFNKTLFNDSVLFIWKIFFWALKCSFVNIN